MNREKERPTNGTRLPLEASKRLVK